VRNPHRRFNSRHIVSVSRGLAPSRDYHNATLKSDGTVWTWGWNINGQLGDNTTIDRNVPVQVIFVQPSVLLPLIQR